MKHALAGVVALLLAGGALVAQQPTFRVQIDAIELDAFVTDAQGKSVTGLTVDDFQVFEDGKPQTIISFSQVDIPFERRTESADAKGPVEPDVLGNDHSDGRVYMFVLDEVAPAAALRARIFLKQFINNHFAANDQAAVVFIGHQDQKAAQMFTSNPRLLVAAIDRFIGGVTTEDAPEIASLAAGFRTAQQAQANIAGLATMDGLESAVSVMARLHGRRKAMLLFSSGLPDALFRALSYGGGAMTKAEAAAHAAVTAATRANVTIYTVDPAGLVTGMADGGTGRPTDHDVTSDDPAANGIGPLDNRMSLSMLADATGGFSLVNSNSFTSAFDRIVRENSTYYLLGFTSSNDRRDGLHRSLRVRVTRPGLEVRTREGYIAPLKNEHLPEPSRFAVLSTPVANSVLNPVSDGTVPIRMFAAPYRREGKNALVAITAEIDPVALGLTESSGVFKGQLEIGFLANNMSGRIFQGQHYLADLALKRETYDMARRRQALRVLTEIRLPPGRYQLHFAAGNPVGKSGNVTYDLTVPDFHKGALMLSGLTLTSDSTSGAATLAQKNPLGQLLPRPPTAERAFDADDTLVVFGEVYDNASKGAPARIETRADMRASDGHVARSAPTSGDRFTVELPLKGLAPGPYVIHVEASALGGKPRTASRDIPIRVR